MVISHGMTGLGDLGSPPKNISRINLPVTSAKLAKQQKLNTLVAISKYNRDLAAGNINPNFVKPPSAETEEQARAIFLGKKAPVATLTTSTPSAGPALLSPAALSSIFANKSITKALPGATPVAVPTPVQQAAAAIVASPPLQTQQSALTTTGGGGGGGGGDMSPADTTDATLPDDTATGWAGLSSGAKVGVVLGGAAAVGLIIYMVRRNR